MHAGLPVIAGDLGGQTDFLRDGDNALLVLPGDVTAKLSRRSGVSPTTQALRRMLAAERPRDRRRIHSRRGWRLNTSRFTRAAGAMSDRTNVREQIEHYERMAAKFDRSVWSLGNRDNRNHLVKVRAIADALGASRGGHVLEVGTGTGLHARWLLENTAGRRHAL